MEFTRITPADEKLNIAALKELGYRNHYSASMASAINALTGASTKEPVAAGTSWLAINLPPGKHPQSGFGQVARHGYHCLLMILSLFDPLIQPYDVASGKPALIDHDQIARLYKRPLQIS